MDSVAAVAPRIPTWRIGVDDMVGLKSLTG